MTDLEFREIPITEKEQIDCCTRNHYNCEWCPYGVSDITEDGDYTVNCKAIIKDEE